MEKKYFYKLSAKKKLLFIISKLSIAVLVLIMGIIAINASGLELPTVSDQLNFGLGVTLITIIVVLALLNRVKALFKIKSVGFVVSFLLLMAFKSTIDVLVWSVGLISLPLLVDDLIITPLWDSYVYNRFEE